MRTVGAWVWQEAPALANNSRQALPLSRSSIQVVSR